MRYRRLAGRVLIAIAVSVAILSGQAVDRPDLDALYTIKEESCERSKVMEIASYLTDIYGPRLTNSPNIKAAANWTMARMNEWGLGGVKLEPWGPFGRGWSNEKFYVQATAPQKYPIFGYPKAWTPGTNGLVSGEAAVAVIREEKDFDTYRGKLKGKFVLTAPSVALRPAFDPLAVRNDEKGLEEISRQPPPPPVGGGRGAQPGGVNAQEFNRRRLLFLMGEGALATLEPSAGINGGTIFVAAGQTPSSGGRGKSNPRSRTQQQKTVSPSVVAGGGYQPM